MLMALFLRPSISINFQWAAHGGGSGVNSSRSSGATMCAGAARVQLPASTQRLEVRTPDGESLAGVRNAVSGSDCRLPAPTLLGFGGNAWNAEATALSLHALFPHRSVVAFHYRGYAPSSGSPSARALFSDSLMIFDDLVPTQAGERVSSGRLQHRRRGRRTSWPASTCCGG